MDLLFTDLPSWGVHTPPDSLHRACIDPGSAAYLPDLFLPLQRRLSLSPQDLPALEMDGYHLSSL